MAHTILDVDEEIPAGYQLLVPGSIVAVSEMWYQSTMSRCQGKSASYILTTVTNGLIRPWEVVRGGTSAYDGTPLEPVIDALKLFGMNQLGMPGNRVTNILCNTLYNAMRKLNRAGEPSHWTRDDGNLPND